MQNDIKEGDIVYYERRYSAQRVIKIDVIHYMAYLYSKVYYILEDTECKGHLSRATRPEISKINPKADE